MLAGRGGALSELIYSGLAFPVSELASGLAPQTSLWEDSNSAVRFADRAVNLSPYAPLVDISTSIASCTFAVKSHRLMHAYAK